jgi:hypothetical protein
LKNPDIENIQRVTEQRNNSRMHITPFFSFFLATLFFIFLVYIMFHIYVILLYTLHDDFMQFTAQSTGEIRKIFNGGGGT